MRTTSLVMSLLMAVSAFLQLNDPDPLRWFAIYGAAAAISLAICIREVPAWLPAAVAVVALAWAVGLAPAGMRGLAGGNLFAAMDASMPDVESGREFLGLGCIAIWMGVLSWWSRRVARAA